MIQTGLADNIQHPPVQITNNDESTEISEHPQSGESFEDQTTDNIRIVPPIPTLNNDPNDQSIKGITGAPLDDAPLAGAPPASAPLTDASPADTPLYDNPLLKEGAMYV